MYCLLLVTGRRLGVVVLINCSNGVAAQLGVARVATGIVRLLLGLQPLRVRPSFRVFYLLVDALVVVLSSLQVWFGLSLLRGLAPLAPLTLLALFVDLVPLLTLWLLPRLEFVDSSWSLLRWYVPDLTIWLWLMALVSVLNIVVWGHKYDGLFVIFV